MAYNTQQNREQTEQSTTIVPLLSTRLYLNNHPTFTGHVEISVINAVKLSFVAHLRTTKDEQYQSVSCSLYAVDVFILLDEMEAAFSTEGEIECSASVSTNYDNNRRDSTIILARNAEGIWSLVLNATGKAVIKFPFTGIRGTTTSTAHQVLLPSRLSMRHVSTWAKLLKRQTYVVQAMAGIDSKRDLPPRNGTQEFTN